MSRKSLVSNRRVKAGVWYFPDYRSARYEAEALEDDGTIPADENEKIRINYFERGWAIQRYRSGPYWGPKGWK